MSYCHNHHPSLQPSQMPDRGQGYIVQWSSVSSRNTGLGHGTVLATVIIMHAAHSESPPLAIFPCDPINQIVTACYCYRYTT